MLCLKHEITDRPDVPADIAATSIVGGSDTRAVTIDYNDGLFTRNDVEPTISEDGNTITQLFATEASDGNFYEVKATFTFNGGDRSDSSNYTVAFEVDLTSAGLVQVSPGNHDATAVTSLTVGDSPLDANEDLLNLDLSTAPGITASGLFAVTGGG